MNYEGREKKFFVVFLIKIKEAVVIQVVKYIKNGSE